MSEKSGMSEWPEFSVGSVLDMFEKAVESVAEGDLIFSYSEVIILRNIILHIDDSASKALWSSYGAWKVEQL